jgi:hypothetical protein
MSDSVCTASRPRRQDAGPASMLHVPRHTTAPDLVRQVVLTDSRHQGVTVPVDGHMHVVEAVVWQCTDEDSHLHTSRRITRHAWQPHAAGPRLRHWPAWLGTLLGAGRDAAADSSNVRPRRCVRGRAYDGQGIRSGCARHLCDRARVVVIASGGCPRTSGASIPSGRARACPYSERAGPRADHDRSSRRRRLRDRHCRRCGKTSGHP